MHPWEPRKGNTPSDHRTKTWVPVVEVSLAERWSHASLVDDHCVRREVRSQAVRERRRRLDLATEQHGSPFDGGSGEAAVNGCERLDFAGSNPHSSFDEVARHRARHGRRRPEVVARRSLPGGENTLLAAAVKDEARRKTSPVVARSSVWSRGERAVVATEDVRGRFAFRVRLLQPQARGVGNIETIQPDVG